MLLSRSELKREGGERGKGGGEKRPARESFSYSFRQGGGEGREKRGKEGEGSNDPHLLRKERKRKKRWNQTQRPAITSQNLKKESKNQKPSEERKGKKRRKKKQPASSPRHLQRA